MLLKYKKASVIYDLHKHVHVHTIDHIRNFLLVTSDKHCLEKLKRRNIGTKEITLELGTMCVQSHWIPSTS